MVDLYKLPCCQFNQSSLLLIREKVTLISFLYFFLLKSLDRYGKNGPMGLHTCNAWSVA